VRCSVCVVVCCSACCSTCCSKFRSTGVVVPPAYISVYLHFMDSRYKVLQQVLLCGLQCLLQCVSQCVLQHAVQCVLVGMCNCSTGIYHIVCCITTSRQYATGWRRTMGCRIFIGHFSQMSPITNGSLAKNDLQLQASFGSSPPCITVVSPNSITLCAASQLRDSVLWGGYD